MVRSLLLITSQVSFWSYQNSFSQYNGCLFFLRSGKWLGNRQIRCNWATKGANAGEEKQSTDSKGMVQLINGTSGEHMDFLFLRSLF
jgi:hypothetical protein